MCLVTTAVKSLALYHDFGGLHQCSDCDRLTKLIYFITYVYIYIYTIYILYQKKLCKKEQNETAQTSNDENE